MLHFGAQASQFGGVPGLGPGSFRGVLGLGAGCFGALLVEASLLLVELVPEVGDGLLGGVLASFCLVASCLGLAELGAFQH
jgi:hypothetical protein